MKNYHILILAALLCLSSCTTDSEWHRGTSGAVVGSMFGSIIGDIVGGPRGGNVGALVGGAAGAAAGVASAKAEQQRREGHYADNNRNNYNYEDDFYYGSGNDYDYAPPANPSQQLSVSNVVFADQNGNRILEGGETASLTFEIRNHGNRPIHNVAPVVTVNNNRIQVSPTATIARIEAGRGIRYKAVVCAQQNVRSGVATFDIGFAQNRGIDHVKTLRIDVRR